MFIDHETADDLILVTAFVLSENDRPITPEAVTVHLLAALYIRPNSPNELHARALEIYSRAVEVLGNQ